MLNELACLLPAGTAALSVKLLSGSNPEVKHFCVKL